MEALGGAEEAAGEEDEARVEGGEGGDGCGGEAGVGATGDHFVGVGH